MAEPEFSTDQLLEQAQGNITAIILGTLAYLKAHSLSSEEFIAFMGKLVAPGWEEVKGQGARAAMKYIARNASTTGAGLASISGDENQAEVVLTNWPSTTDLEVFGVTQEEVDAFAWAIYHPVAAYLNLHYEWQRHGNQIVVRLTR